MLLRWIYRHHHLFHFEVSYKCIHVLLKLVGSVQKSQVKFDGSLQNEKGVETQCLLPSLSLEWSSLGEADLH